MCDAKQRSFRNKKPKESPTGKMGGGKLNESKGIVAVIIGILAVVIVGFVLFTMVDFDVDTEVSSANIELSTNDIFLMNQSRGMGATITFITDDVIYFTGDIALTPFGREIFRTSDYFETYELITILESWMITSIHVTEDAIYYTVWGDLYRYCLSSDETISIADEIHNKVIVDNLVFHQRGEFRGDNLYTLDLTNGERTLLIEDVCDDGNFVIDQENDRIIFRRKSINEVQLEQWQLFQTDLSGENETLLRYDAWDFSVGNNIIAYRYRFNISISNLETGVTTIIERDSDIHNLQLNRGIFLGEYLISTCRDRYLWLVDTNNVDQYQQLTDYVISNFTVLGNDIIYTIGVGGNIYITDLNGNSRIVIPYSD